MEFVPVDGEPAAAVFLVVGIPGSGKSTVARSLAGRFERGAHIEVDALQDLIVSGGHLPEPTYDREADRQIFLRARNASLLARSFHAAGIVPVIDDVVVRRSHLAYYRECLRDLPLRLIVLAPGAKAAAARIERRDKKLADDWSFLDDAMRDELKGEGTWIDSAAQTPDQTVQQILTLSQGQAAG